jgi:hypothetical protein
MRAVVVYESMFGNTHVVADHIAAGLRTTMDVATVAVDGVTPDALDGVDLLVVGGPTHVHGMSSHKSRSSAADMTAKPDSGLELDPDAEGEGLREWFHQLPELSGVRAAAFDTRIGVVAPVMSGRASKESRGASATTAVTWWWSRRASSSTKTTISSTARRSGRARGGLRSSSVVMALRSRHSDRSGCVDGGGAGRRAGTDLMSPAGRLSLGGAR